MYIAVGVYMYVFLVQICIVLWA